MSVNNLKTHYSAKELAELSLTCLPKTNQGVLYQAKKQNWKACKKVGVGGEILEFALIELPDNVQQEIRTKLLKLLPAETSKGELSIKRQQLKLAQVSQRQLSTADGRITVVRWYLGQEKRLALSRNKAMNMVVEAVATGQIPEEICKAIIAGNGKGGRKAQIIQTHTL